MSRILSLALRYRSQTSLSHESSQIHPFSNSWFLTGRRLSRRGNQTVANPAIAEESKEKEDISDSVDPVHENKNDSSAVKYSVFSNLKSSPWHNLGMTIICKFCKTRSIKMVCLESCVKGVVVARCHGCNHLHLLADHLGWFGEPGSLEDFLAARGEEVRKGCFDSLSLTLEDLPGKEP